MSFDKVSVSLRELFLDLDFFAADFNLQIDNNTFSNIPQLKRMHLNLNKRVDLILMPNLKSSPRLEELTIQNTKLSQITTGFCHAKRSLKTLNLSNNNFQVAMLIFYFSRDQKGVKPK